MLMGLYRDYKEWKHDHPVQGHLADAGILAVIFRAIGLPGRFIKNFVIGFIFGPIVLIGGCLTIGYCINEYVKTRPVWEFKDYAQDIVDEYPDAERLMAEAGYPLPPKGDKGSGYTEERKEWADLYYQGVWEKAQQPQTADSDERRSYSQTPSLRQRQRQDNRDPTQTFATPRQSTGLEPTDAESMLARGIQYASGQGVPQDYQQAMKWFRKGADAGNATALHNVGWLYSEGLGVAKNVQEALRWYLKAAELGRPEDMFLLAHLYREGEILVQDPVESFKWLKKAAMAGYTPAMLYVGLAYGSGNGVEQDKQQALVWYRKGATEGDSACMMMLSGAYLMGEGVQKDVETGLMWVRKAAEAGNEEAKKALAKYENDLRN